MSKGKHRVLFISSGPIQNAAPLRLLAQHPQIDMLMAYCSLPDAELWHGPEYLTKAAFDIPVLDGYPWISLPNRSPVPSLAKSFGLINPGLMNLVPKFDCCVVYGHAYVSFWLAIGVAKLTDKPLLLSTDATYLEPAQGGNWKVPLKRRLLPFLYNRVADVVIVPSTASKQFIHSLGVPEGRIVITPYTVDNDYIAAIAARADRQQIRQEWQVPEDGRVVLFCAKFLPRKRPQHVLKAFALANVPNSYLVFVGEGPLGESLRSQTEQLGLNDRVRFIGMVKYSHLPEVYTTGDVLVVPSDHEPYGLPVNEAMVCGLPVIVSDRIGAGYDLVQEGVTGFTYPSGNIEALAAILKKVLSDRGALKQMGAAACKRMETWSSRENAEATVQAIEKAITLKRGRAKRVHPTLEKIPGD